MPFLKSFELGQKLGLTHNIGYRYASKSIQGAVDVDFDLVVNKTLSQKNGSLGWGPGPAKIPKHALFVTSPGRKPPTETEKRFFFISTRRLAESVEGLNSSLAQSPGEL